MRTIIFYLVLATCIPFLACAQQPEGKATINHIHDYCRQLLLSDTAYATEQSYRLTDDIKYKTDATGYFNSLTSDGSWKDINYQSQMRGSWLPSWHLYRVMLLCKAYHKNNDPAYLSAIHKALAFWIRHDFKCENWWQNNINIPFAFSSIVLMLDDKAKPDEVDFLNNTIVSRIPVYKATGQNLIWQLDNEARVAIIHRDYTALAYVILRMQTVIQVSLGEGIQPDYSFQQHGKMMQFGNYGLHFVNSLLFWMTVTANTPLAFEKEKQQILFDYCARGLKWTVYKGSMDITAVGRQLRENSGIKRGDNLLDDFNLISSIDQQNNCQYQLDGFNYPNRALCRFSGNRSFWCSDYMVSLSKNNYMMSVKTNGYIVKRIESINTENLKGAFLNDGVALIQRTGKEYKNIEPLWNWSMLPGTTSDTSIAADSKQATSSANHSNFVGQVSDGVNGISAMYYDRLNIKAFKSYFFTGDMMIALGAGIEAPNTEHLVTTVNQRFYKGTRLIGGKSNTGQQYLWQDSTGYFFPDQNEPVKTKVEFRKGDWYDVDNASGHKQVADSLLTLYIEHTKNNKYVYLVKPGISLKEVQNGEFAKNANILANTADIQAIRVREITMVVFYRPGSINIANETLRTDKPCILIYHGGGKPLWVSDQTRLEALINLKIGAKSYEVHMPSGNAAGSSVKVN